MQISKDHVVQFHYTLSEENGSELENSHTGDPVAYLHGHGGVIRGLAEALEGKVEGENFSITLAPEDAYGTRNEDASQRIPIKHLLGTKKPRKGQVVAVQTEQGQRQVTVEKVGRFNVDVDTNHPFSGKTLTFNIEILSVREATAEELRHGHAHGVGGHHH